MSHFPSRECGYAILTVTLAVLIYVGAYCLMVKPMVIGFGPWEAQAEYRFGGEYSAVLFSPLERLDRQMFPKRWINNLPAKLIPSSLPSAPE
jgi:hypothetical protein